jgi:membrane associated rhomboid family serine protease
MAFLPLRDQNPTRGRPWATYTLMAINVAVYVCSAVMIARGAFWLVPAYGFVPARFQLDPVGEAFTLGTSVFLHGDIVHLGVNLLSLHIFGDNLEEALGPLRFCVFYVLCGLAAAGAHFAVDPLSVLPMLGASGAISGVMAGYLLLFPRAPVLSLSLIPLLWLVTGILPSVPAWVVGAEFLLANVWEAWTQLSAQGGGGIAVFAHLGGFAAGLVLVKVLLKEAPVLNRAWNGFRNRPLPAGTQGTARWRRRLNDSDSD